MRGSIPLLVSLTPLRHVARSRAYIAALLYTAQPNFFLDEKNEINLKYRPQWGALSEKEQQEYSVRFDYFLHHENARMADLEAAHVLALRLYTTHAFK